MIIETFVDANRFKGTIYKASNWIYLGRTRGEGRKGLGYYYHGECKDYYIYLLTNDAIKKLRKD